MKLRGFISLFLVFVLMFFITACGNKNGPGLPELPSACDTIQGPSMLCEIAAERGVNLSVVADGLGLASIVAIRKGLYTADQATKALIGLRVFMDSPVSYAALKFKIDDTIATYPYLLQTVDKYTSALVSTQIMYAEDQRLIKSWLDRLILSLQPRGQPA